MPDVIKNTDKDFQAHQVFVHGTPVTDVLSADVARGEVWVHHPDDPTKPLELKTGTVTIVPKPQASAGRTSGSRRSTSGA